MIPRLQQTKIQFRFVTTIIILMVSFLMLLLVGTYTLEFFRITRQIERQLKVHADERLDKIELRISYLQESINGFASSSLVINSMVDVSGRINYLPSAVKDFSRLNGIRNVVVFDFIGNPVDKSGELLPVWYSREFVQKTISLGQEQLYFDTTLGALVFVMPIVYYDTAQGGVAVEVDIDELVSGLLDTDFGYRLSMNNNWMIDFNYQQDRAFTANSSLLPSSMLGRFNTSLSISLAENRAMRPVWISLAEMALTGFIGIVLSLLIAINVGKRLAQPILLLTDRVRKNIHPTAPLGTNDELELLAKSFDDSHQEMKQARDDLELRVDERTKQISEYTEILEKRTMELEKLNNELSMLDKLKDEFVSTVSHELRTPLTSIRGSLALLVNNGVNDSAQQLDMLEIALSNSERLSKLINDLLDFNKLMAEHIALEISPVSINCLIDRIITDLEGFSRKFSVTINHRLCENDDPVIYVDEGRIRQVLDNLISNAIKYSPTGGEVDVFLETGEQSLRIYVRDHGPGIPEDFRDRIFDKFTQADSSDSRHHAGTGLGLSISKRLIEAHQGMIGFQDAEEGGTIFWIELPFSNQQSAAAE